MQNSLQQQGDQQMLCGVICRELVSHSADQNGDIDDAERVKQHLTDICTNDKNGKDQQRNAAHQREGYINRRRSQRGENVIMQHRGRHEQHQKTGKKAFEPQMIAEGIDDQQKIRQKFKEMNLPEIWGALQVRLIMCFLQDLHLSMDIL